ncbi:hypothetical protein J2S14_002316 [Lederbergia wuyishanensis]|uniref:Uncharacterized protein n=1 Tax=Lederbergia wuyishanensis TaxID=1347903 RepID=A0ABU0D535_9BACI|nr:hypothetical protein [Lederbergia wuyishanensis]
MEIGERNPEIDNVAAAALSMFFAPIILFIFNIMFYLSLYFISIRKFPKHLSSWKLLLLDNKSLWLNFLRLTLYLICLWTVIDTVQEEVVPMWVIITLPINMIVYGYWVLQMIVEGSLFLKN